MGTQMLRTPLDMKGTSWGKPGEGMGWVWGRGGASRGTSRGEAELLPPRGSEPCPEQPGLPGGCRHAVPCPQNVQLSSLHNLNFTIMETRCQARSGAQLDSCEFKEDGVSAVLGWGAPGAPGGRDGPVLSVPLLTARQGLRCARGAARRPRRVRCHLRGLHG